MANILYICLMLIKARHIICLICIGLFLVFTSYNEAQASIIHAEKGHQVNATFVQSLANQELKAILEQVIEIGSVNTSARSILGIKKDGGVLFYELSSIKEKALLKAGSVFYASHQIPLYISFRSILI